MIRVDITMVPAGIEAHARHMATIEIANDVEQTVASDGKKGSYYARVSRISQRGEHLGWYDRIAHVHDIARNRSGAVYRILHGILTDHLEGS